MRSFGSRLLLIVVAVVKSAAAQGPVGAAPAEKPAAGSSEAASAVAVASEPAAGVAAPAAMPSGVGPEPGSGAAAAGEAPTPAPESAPASEKTPEQAPIGDAPSAEAIGRANEVAPQSADAARVSGRVSAPWIRAHSPLTLEGRLGFLVRPDSSAGFDEESHVGAELGLSLYLDLKREIAAGLEIERASLGRGSAVSGVSSVNVDYTVTSAMLGFRAYPKRTELLDLFVGLQVGVGIQGVSAAGTQSQGMLLPPVAYKCGGSDAPAFQIGGGVGARLMISPRWGVTGRINGTGRRLSSEVVDECAQGIGTAATVSAGIGLGYDFDLDP